MDTKFSETDIFKRAYEQCREYLEDSAWNNYNWYRVNWIDRGKFGSPIEAVFYLWWKAIIHGAGSSIALGLEPQKEVLARWDWKPKRYRLDFAVMPDDSLYRRVFENLKLEFKFAIELDGHEFHERTKAQVDLRNERDRALQSCGWQVHHVSGSELYRDGPKTVLAVLTAAEFELRRLRMDALKQLTGQLYEDV